MNARCLLSIFSYFTLFHCTSVSHLRWALEYNGCLVPMAEEKKGSSFNTIPVYRPIFVHPFILMFLIRFLLIPLTSYLFFHSLFQVSFFLTTSFCCLYVTSLFFEFICLAFVCNKCFFLIRINVLFVAGGLQTHWILTRTTRLVYLRQP